MLIDCVIIRGIEEGIVQPFRLDFLFHFFLLDVRPFCGWNAIFCLKLLFYHRNPIRATREMID